MYQNNYKKSDRQQNYVEKPVNIHFNEKDEIVGENGASYVDVAKSIIEKVGKNTLSTSKLRNVLSNFAEIYKNAINGHGDLNDMASELQYFRIRCLYEAGRDSTEYRPSSIKSLFINSNLIELVNEIKNSKKRLINYYHYLEALVAWFKYSCKGKD